MRATTFRRERIGEFVRCGFTLHAPGPATQLIVTVKAPATSHGVRLSKIEAWLENGGKSPNEQAMKVSLRELLGIKPISPMLHWSAKLYFSSRSR
jgi:hypothetical protein